MADQPSTPPKPKVGSLRDRIAAFEKSASAAPSGPAPAPRPKPAGFATWKPKVPSPPSSPAASTTEHASSSTSSSSKVAGMSASDAKESITAGGSLKERMAALQGKGAFGAPPPVAPKPSVERPKWKPPPAVQAPADDDDGEATTSAIAAAVGRTISPPVVKSPESILSEGAELVAAPPATTTEGENEEEATPDPEEEERQRRAAIAARMARLGGARVGMAPPIIGKKPVRRPTQEEELKPAVDELKKVSEEQPTNETTSPEVAKSAEDKASDVAELVAVGSPPTVTSVEATAEPGQTSEYSATRKNSENASLLSTESTESHPAKSPPSMPVPAVPRRAGLPRKKPAKSAPPPEVPEEVPQESSTPGAAEEPRVEDSAEKPIEAIPDTNPSPDTPFTPVHAERAPLPVVDEHPTTEGPVETHQPEQGAEKRDESPNKAISSEDSKEIVDTPLSEAINPVEAAPEVSSTPRLSTPADPKQSIEEVLDDSDEELSELATASSLVSPSAAVHTVLPTPNEVVTPVSSADAQVPEELDEAAEEDARKKRVAEKLAKMGGINPFALPPARVVSPPKAAPSSPPMPPPSVSPPMDAALSRSPSPEAVQPNVEGSLIEAHVKSKDDGDTDGEDEASDYEPEPTSQSEQPEKREEATVSQLRSHPQPQRPVPVTHPSFLSTQTEKFDSDDGKNSGDDRDIFTQEDSLASPTAEDPPSPPARSTQPPRRIAPRAPEDEVEDEDPQTDEEADERLAQSHLFIPPPTMPNRSRFQDEDDGDGDGSENDSPALPVLQRRSMEVPAPRTIPSRSVPQPPPSDYDSDLESDHDGRALPVPPPHTGPALRTIPPPPPPAAESAPPSQPDSPNPQAKRLTLSVPVSDSEEILDEEEGDPIDPAFHSPSRQTSHVNLRAAAQLQAHEDPEATPTIASPPVRSPPPPARPPPIRSPATSPPPVHSVPPAGTVSEPSDEVLNPEDAEQLRRKTIAERMAKLGGIRFGAAPVPSQANRPPPPPHQEELVEDAGPDLEEEEKPLELTEEEEERARKERITAKLSQMGGMRIGMMPMGMGGLPPQRSHALREETPSTSAPPKPARAPSVRAIPPTRPPPPPSAPVAAPDTDSESAAASEDGVKVEAEESEIEEVSYEDAAPEEVPPIPSRSGRQSHRRESTETATSPPPPHSRPPVPTSPPRRRSSVQTTSSASGIEPLARKTSLYMPQSEYVMVEEPESQGAPPPPPARPTNRPPPTRSTPKAPTMSPDPSDSLSSSQWELPSIPNMDFGASNDLSLSWTDAGETGSPPSSAAPPASSGKQPAAPPKPLSDKPMSADDLMMIWGRVGVQVCEVATSLFEKSKKTLIGDGSYVGFAKAVLADVPNAAPVSYEHGEYGYLVYVQNGAAVQKRASDIMPGDIVEIHDGKFKGHKGLQTYHQNVGGSGEVLVGVVGEFEAKKSKVRVFQANQHVGQQTVESVSYRLEDLKSGVVKVYRVLEA